MDEINDSKNFQALMADVNEQLYYATCHLKIFEGLNPDEDYDGVMARYQGFFNLDRRAHRQSFFIAIANVLRKRDRKAGSWDW